MADQFESFNRMAEMVQPYPMLASQELEDRFREIDVLLQRGIQALLATTHFVEDNLCYRLAEITIGSLKAKIYRGRFVKSCRAVGQGVMIGSENQKILGVGFDLFKLSRTARDVATPLVQRILRSLRLQNITYEQILRAFATVTQQYRETCEQLAQQQQQLKQQERQGVGDLVQPMQRISALIDQKRQTESRAGCVDTNSLYGTVALVHRYLIQVDRVQDKIVKAYLRSIPRVVRRYAHSDMDALDLFQAGSFGLLHAVKAYDYRSRAGFSGFARRWIRERIQKAFKQSSGPLIKLAPKVWEDAQKIRRATAVLRDQTSGQDPTHEEIAAELGWAAPKIDQVLAKIDMCQIVSLDDVTQADHEIVDREATVQDTEDDEQEELAQYRDQVIQIINHLEPQDQHLICLHYGCVELIQNNQIDRFQALKEQLRQLACKTLQHQYLAGRLDNGISATPLEEKDDDEQI